MPLNADTKEIGGMASANTQSITQGSSFGGPATPDRKSTRLNSSHSQQSRMPSSA